MTGNRGRAALLPRSFNGELVGAVETVKGSAPSAVRPLAEENPPRDLDLVEMAAVAMHYLTHNPRRHLDWECRFSIVPLNLPPAPEGPDPITLGDTDCRMDWEYLYMREMCGSSEGREVEEGVRRRILSYLREDGLSWVPMHHYCIPDLKDLEPAASVWATNKTLLSLSETHLRTGDSQAKALARKIFLALKGLASWDGGRAYYEGGTGPWRSGKWIDSFVTVTQPSTLEPVVRYWECTGDEEAGEFAVALGDGIIADLQRNLGDNRILDDGSFLQHVHAHGHAVWGVAHLGAVTGERRYLEWARRVLEFMLRTQATDYGWVAEWVGGRKGGRAFNTGRSEVCAVSDAVSIAACLARAGYAEYWDWIERCVRNYLREMQFAIKPEYEADYRRLHGSKADEGLRMMRDFEGGFVASTLPNSWLDRPDHMDMMGCCPPEGMRALYTAWTNAVTESKDGVFVNLSLDRDAPAAGVVSFLPEQGRLTVTAKRSGDFFVRPPAWAAAERHSASCEPAGVKAYRGAREVPVEWRRDYVAFKGAAPGEELTITYPLIRFRQKAEVGVGEYTMDWDGVRFVFRPTSEPQVDEYLVDWLGNTVTGLEPRAPVLPIFVKG